MLSGKIHVHPSLAEIQSLGFQALNKLLGRLFHALLGRDINCEPWRAFVAALVVESGFSLIETEEDYLRQIETRIVLRNRVLLSEGERILANNGLHVGIFAARELVGRMYKRVEFIEEEECCR